MSVSVLPFRHPTTILVSGPTGCGKTRFVQRLLDRNERAIVPFPERIVWVYSEWQPAYDELARSLQDRIEFVKDYDPAELYESFDRNTKNMLVLDDQMGIAEGRELCKLFTQGSHHRNLTVLYIVQNLFFKDGAMCTVARNSHYKVLFKNPGDMRQLSDVAQQSYPGKSDFVHDAFTIATKNKPYSYMLMDFRPDIPDDVRVRTNIFDRKRAKILTPIKGRRATKKRKLQ